MAELTRHDMQLLQEHDQHQQAMMKEQLDQMGIQLRVAHFTGDSSYPTEYTLRYSFVSATGPTFGLALAAFVEALLKYVPVEKALTEEEQKIVEYNKAMDERNRIIRESVEKPWLPLHDGE